MAYARANMFYERESWRKPLAISLGFHALLGLTIFLLGFVMEPSGSSTWGDNQGEAIPAQLVSGAPIPIPKPDTPTDNIVVNESKGKTETVPHPKVAETDDGVTIPGKVIQPKVNKAVTATNVKPHPVPTPTTAVPYGERGPVSGPYGAFTAPNTKGGFSFQNGDFGSRFGWYQTAMTNKISSVWYQAEIDPRVTSAKRVYILFDIQKDGTPANVRIEQSSGIPSLDQSALRALQRIDTFGRLPPEYTGSKVSVEFWFDYQR
jgi:periplasmic protein TonB